MYMKTVGVVIPIYNVEKYLKECLDSVINQTYTNLEIILVNDGSTDENSLNIAKEYTLKDKRITLFDKKNGGLSSARNVGIEYFSGEYKLKNKTQTIKENSLIEFNIEGNNPYEIYTVYKSYKAFNNEQDLISFTYPIIDYIIFLDSDDYWELNCIEECVPRMDGVDVVWFDWRMFIDASDCKNVKNPNWNKMYNFSLDNKITRSDFIKEINRQGKFEFPFACDGMIDFKFLVENKIKFPSIKFAEDHYFGLSCFLSFDNVYIFKKKFYNYRVRSNSLCDFSQLYCINPSDKILYSIYNKMNKNAKLALEYYKTCCFIDSTLCIIDFFEKKVEELDNNMLDFFRNIIKGYYIRCIKINDYTIDPLDKKKQFKKILFYHSLFCRHTHYDKYKESIFFKMKYGTAKARVKNQLSYRLGQSMVVNSKNIFTAFLLPLYIMSIILIYKQEKKIYEDKIKKDPSLKLPALQSYSDYKEALLIKNHLSYKLGQVLIEDFKYWYKGYLLKLPFDIIKTYRKFKISKIH